MTIAFSRLMPPIPHYLPTPGMVEVTHRTVGGRRLLRPVPGLTALILGVLGRALRLYPIDLHAFVYLSNHVHFLLSIVSSDVLAAFERYMKTNTALAAKRFVEWEGPVWTRSTVVPVLDDAASVRRLRYVISNSVKEGLVETPLDWPGASGAAALLDGQPIPASWVASTARGRKPPRSAQAQDCSITLAPLPCWRGLALEDRRQRVARMMDDVVAETKLAREGRPPLGVEGVLACDPFEPVELEETRAPLCHTTDPRLRAQFMVDRVLFIDAYRVCADEFRDEALATKFPDDSFPPAPAFSSRRSPANENDAEHPAVSAADRVRKVRGT